MDRFAMLSAALAAIIVALLAALLLKAVRRRRERGRGGYPYSRGKKRLNPSQTD